MITEQRALQRLATAVIMQAIRDLRGPVAEHREAAKEWLFGEASRADREHWCAQAAQPYSLLERLSAVDEGEIKRRLKGRAWLAEAA